MSNDDYEVTSVKPLYDGRAFSVEERTIRRPDGKTIIRDLVKHDPVVFILIHRNDTDEYLIEHEYRTGVGSIVAGLPAGFIDKDEDPMSAAMREVREGTGVVLEPSELEKIGEWYSSQGFTDEKATFYLAEIDEVVNVGTDLDDDEQLTSEWVSSSQLMSMVDDGSIDSSVAVAGILKACNRKPVMKYDIKRMVDALHERYVDPVDSLMELSEDERPVDDAFKYAHIIEDRLSKVVDLDLVQVWPTNNNTIEFGVRIDRDNQLILEAGKGGITGFYTIDGVNHVIELKSSNDF